jgi:hypothetical protein
MGGGQSISPCDPARVTAGMLTAALEGSSIAKRLGSRSLNWEDQMWVLAKCAVLLVGPLLVVQLVVSVFETVAQTRQASTEAPAVAAPMLTSAPMSRQPSSVDVLACLPLVDATRS